MRTLDVNLGKVLRGLRGQGPTTELLSHARRPLTAGGAITRRACDARAFA